MVIYHGTTVVYAAVRRWPKRRNVAHDCGFHMTLLIDSDVFLTLIRFNSVMETHHGFCVVEAGFWSSLEKSQATKGYRSWSTTVQNAKHVWTHQLCVAQADSATLAETLKSESSRRHYQLQRLTTRGIHSLVRNR